MSAAEASRVHVPCRPNVHAETHPRCLCPLSLSFLRPRNLINGLAVVRPLGGATPLVWEQLLSAHAQTDPAPLLSAPDYFWSEPANPKRTPVPVHLQDCAIANLAMLTGEHPAECRSLSLISGGESGTLGQGQCVHLVSHT